LELAVKNNRIARVNGVEGVKPNDGRLCIKGRFGYEFVASRDRLTRPLIKRNGRFVEADWDEALDLVAAKFSAIKAKFGNDALAGYASAKCTNEDNYIFQKFIRTAFGTNNVDYCTRLCHASTVTAMLRSLGDGAGSNSIEDYETADCILVIGNNMIETHPVTATFVKRGLSNGAKLIVIDPKWTPLAKFADVWLRPRLGTDVALLNGLIHIIISENMIDQDFIINRIEGGLGAYEDLKQLASNYPPENVSKITGIDPDKILLAAGLYARADRALIATGMGISQQVTGTHTVFSLINMCLITGQIGKAGAGLNPPRGQNNVQGASDVGCSPLIYPGYIPVTDDANRKKIAEVWNYPYEALSARIGLTTVEIMQAAHNQTVKGLYIMGENPGYFEVEMGISLKELIYNLAGGIKDHKKFKAALLGGAAGTFVPESFLSIRMDFDSLQQKNAVLGSGAVIVMAEDKSIIDMLHSILRFFEHESCGKCVPCRVGTRQLLILLEKFIANRENNGADIDALLVQSEIMAKTSLCPLGQSPVLPIRSAIQHFRNDLEHPVNSSGASIQLE